MIKAKHTGFLLLAAFLLLGFCPLRNTLVAMAHPTGAAPKVPVYSKIIGQDDCVSAVIQKALPTSGKTLVPPLLMAWLPANRFSFDPLKLSIHQSSRLAILAQVHFNFPIYLRNRCLLI